MPPIVVGIFTASSGGDTARIVQLFSPGDVVDGVNSAIYGPITIANQTIVALLDGWVYAVAALAYIVGSLAIVVRRYLTVTV